MGRWLNRVKLASGRATAKAPDEKSQKSIGQSPYKTYQSSSVGFVGNAKGSFPKRTATAREVEAMLANLYTIGRILGDVEPLLRSVLLKLPRYAATELIIVIDDIFEVAPDNATARTRCHRLLSDSVALAAAKTI